MSSAVVSNAAALRRPFIFDDDAELEASSTTHVGTAAPGCPVEPSSTAMSVAPLLPDVVRHDSRGRLYPHEQLIPSTHNQRFPSASVTPASQLEIRPAPEMVSSGIAELDALTGGLPRGCLTEIYGPASSGRTTVLLAALAAATRRGEFCALIDASDALDALSIAAAGVDLDRLLWVRCGEGSPQRHRGTEKYRNQKEGCPISRAPSAREVGISSQSAFPSDTTRSRASEHRLEQVLRATDLLLESGGFGLILLDLADLPPQATRRIPMTTWFRFRRAVEYKPTILLAIGQQPVAGSCSSLLLQLGVLGTQYPVLSSNRFIEVSDRQQITPQDLKPSHSQLLSKVEIRAELIRSRLERKPARAITFETKTAWAG